MDQPVGRVIGTNGAVTIPDYGEAIAPPASFPFPFQPYDIQDSFMRNLFDAINNRKIGIFESPTGTVRSEVN